MVAVAGCGYAPGFTRLSKIEQPKPKKSTFFLASAHCQLCHPAEYEEWRTSMHAYAQHSPVFLSFNDFVLKSSGGSLGDFCERCHTPVGMSSGESPVEPNSKRSEAALDSVGCIACHSEHTNNAEASGVIHVPVNGDSEPIIYGPYYGYDEPGAPKNPAMRLIKTPHESRHSDYFTHARLCAACHDVFSPDGFRIEEAYSEWKNGPYARRGIQCENCHMGPIPGKPFARTEFTRDYIVDPNLFPNAPKRYRSNHRFTGPDYSLLAAFGQNALSLDSASFKKLEAQLETQRETLLRNAATMRVKLPGGVTAGAALPITVAVTNSGAGHNLPTGFAAERQLWLEVIVTDSTGRQIFISGNTDENGDLLDPDSEEVRAGKLPIDLDLFNLEAQFINLDFKGTDAENISTVNRFLDPVPFVTPPQTPSLINGNVPAGRIFKRGIPPLETRTADYRVEVPWDAAGPLTVSVRLRYRNLPPHLLAELGIPKYRAKLRVVDLATFKKQVAIDSAAVSSAR